MDNMKKWMIALSALITSVNANVAIAYNADLNQEETQYLPRVISVINDNAITDYQIMQVSDLLKRQLRDKTDRFSDSVINKEAFKRLVTSKAGQAMIDLLEDPLKKHILAQFLASQGLSLEDYLQRFPKESHDMVLKNTILNTIMQSEILNKIQIAEDEQIVKDLAKVLESRYFQEYETKYSKKQVAVKEIFLSYPKFSKYREKMIQKINKRARYIVSQAKEGRSFDLLLSLHSEKPTSSHNAIWKDIEEMPTQDVEAGNIVGPVYAEDGVHIYFVENTRVLKPSIEKLPLPNEYKLKSISISYKNDRQKEKTHNIIKEVANLIKNGKSLKEAASIISRKYQVVISYSTLDWALPNNHFSSRKLQDLLNNMKAHSISDPVEEEKTSSWKIIQVEDVRQASKEKLFKIQAVNFITERRMLEAMPDFNRDILGKVYIKNMTQ